MKDMLKMFAPSASTPPSLNSSACTVSTHAMTIAAAPGPSSAAASTPPSKWPGRAAGHGEIQHLRREHKRRAQPHQRNLVARQRAVDLPRGDGQPARRQRAGQGERLGVEKTIRNVHKILSGQWVCVKCYELVAV